MKKKDRSLGVVLLVFANDARKVAIELQQFVVNCSTIGVSVMMSGEDIHASFEVIVGLPQYLKLNHWQSVILDITDLLILYSEGHQSYLALS